MNKNKKLILSFSLLSFFPFLSAYAEFDPAVIKVGGIDVVPIVGVTESYDSNILLAETAKQTDLIVRVSPKATATIESGANKYSINADVEVGRYLSSSQDNYLDSSIGLDLDQSFTRKFSLNIAAGRLNSHESRGSGYSQAVNLDSLSRPDQYSINQVQAKLSYGSRDSIGRIELDAAMKNRIFNTRRDITKSRDLDNVSAGVTFFYHMMPKTSLLFEVSQQELSYRYGEDYNSREQRILAGARWDVSALTSGTAKAGLLEKNFVDATKRDSSALSWEIGARWMPRTYSTFDLITKGTLDESNSVNDNYIDSRSILVKWVHFWNKSLDTQLNVNATNNIYQPSYRQDKFRSAGIKVNYNFRRWMDVALAYQYSETDSTVANVSFDKNVLSLSIVLGL